MGPYAFSILRFLIFSADDALGVLAEAATLYLS